MLPVAYPLRLDNLTSVWDQYMVAGRLDPDIAAAIDPAVFLSWRRCQLRLNPRVPPRPRQLQAQPLATVLRANADLISLALPFLEDIHQFTESSGCAIVLSDGSACLLAIGGDSGAVTDLEERGLATGTYWAEGQLGTNAVGLTLLEAMPVQVVGPEHYFESFHDLATTAAPVHDVAGRIVGVIGLVTPADQASSHDLALVMATARALSNQIQTNFYLDEANTSLTAMKAILSAMTEGVIAWDGARRITHVNEQAGRMLGLVPASVLGRSLDSTLDLPPAAQNALLKDDELQDVEVVFHVDSESVQCLLTLRPIRLGGAASGGCIAVLRPIEHLRRLAQQQVDQQAALTLDEFMSHAPVMRQVLRQAQIAARGSAPVLLRGEGGTGKNALARAIHDASEREHEPFIAINCRAIPHSIMLSELLGVEKGEGVAGRPSKFELANGGTLLLEQLEHLSLEMQAALLQVIENNHVLRLNSSYPIQVSVRVLGATSVNLEQHVAEGSFLRHLYYSFSVFNLTLPPLRQRLDDLPLLIEQFLTRLTGERDHPFWLQDDVLNVLRRYPWPGNIRELEAVLESALNHSTDAIIRVTDLPEIVRSGRVLTASSPEPQPVLTAAEAEREAIIRAGWVTQGRVTEMARLLDIGRTTLWRKMQRLNLNPDQFRDR